MLRNGQGGGEAMRAGQSSKGDKRARRAVQFVGLFGGHVDDVVACVYVCVCVCLYVCVYVCVCVCM